MAFRCSKWDADWVLGYDGHVLMCRELVKHFLKALHEYTRIVLRDSPDLHDGIPETPLLWYCKQIVEPTLFMPYVHAICSCHTRTSLHRERNSTTASAVLSGAPDSPTD